LARKQAAPQLLEHVPLGIVEMNQSDNLEADENRPRGGMRLFRCQRHDDCKAILFEKQIWTHECEVQTVTDLASCRYASDWNMPPAIRHRG
jgi:hypothetical protein